MALTGFPAAGRCEDVNIQFGGKPHPTPFSRYTLSLQSPGTQAEVQKPASLKRKNGMLIRNPRYQVSQGGSVKNVVET